MADDLFGHLQATLGDSYRLERGLGGGGMGRVFVTARGWSTAWRTGIAAAAGDSARSVALGRHAVAEGLPFQVADWHMLPAFVPVAEHPVLEGVCEAS